MQTKDKISYIKGRTNYEIIDDSYIVAYKAIQQNNYSFFNYKYKYLVGNSYESSCDCNLVVDSSFGLAAWNKDMAINYGSIFDDFKLIKVKIFIDDIGGNYK
jgi:hypothetical protein